MQIRGKNRTGTLHPTSSRLLEYTRPLPSVQTSLRPWSGPPDRKLINECKRGNVVDKFNKIVHAQLVSLGVNTFWWAVPFSTCRNPQLLALPGNDRKPVKFYSNWYALLKKSNVDPLYFDCFVLFLLIICFISHANCLIFNTLKI